MNYAFLDVAQEFQLEIINKFITETNSKVSFMNTAVSGTFHGNEQKCEKYITNLKKLNPEILIKDLSNFLYSDTYSDFISVPWVITEDDILNAKQIESMSIRLMDRSALIPISVFSRRRIYLLLLNYFSYIIEHKKIESIVVFDTPHSFYSHILYELCKLKKKNIVKLEYHYFTDYSILLNQDKWPLIPKEYKKDETIETIKDELPENLRKAVFSSSKYLTQYKSNETKAIVKQNVFSNIKLYSRFFDKAAKNIIMGIFPFFFKKEILHFASLNGIRNRFKYRFFLNFQLFKLIKLNILYNKIANKNLSLDCNYIFVGLHMQPEKTSQPMGGEFDNQLMMIKIISDSIPKGWKVYVKEHPNQFNVKKIPNKHYRDKLFYDCVQKIENCEFVPLEIDSEDLINNSKMVATLTGTLGWEAITKNIPALVFGKTYYMACRACRVISSVNTCKKAIDELSEMNENEMKIEIFRYLSYYHKNNWLVNASNWQSLLELNSLPYEKQIVNIVDRFKLFHSKFLN